MLGQSEDTREESPVHKKRKFGVKMAVTLLMMSQLLSVATPFVAYAEDDDEDEKTESEVSESVRQGNVYADNNALLGGAFEGASKYDPYVHYVSTYNTLMSTLSDGAKSSPYAKVYKGEHGKATSGTGKEITYDVKDTNALSVVTEADNKEHSSGGEAAGDAIEESPNGEMSEAESQAKIKELSKILATNITNNIMAELNKSLTVNAGKKSVEYHVRKGHGYNSGVGYFGQITTRQSVGSGYISIDNLKKSIGSGDGSSTSSKLFKEKLYKEVYKDVSTGNYTLKKVEDTFSKNSIVGRKIELANSSYTAEYNKKGVDTGNTGLYLSPMKYVGNNWVSVKSGLKKWSDAEDNLTYLIRVSSTKDVDAGRAITTTTGLEFISSRYMWTFSNLPIEKKANVGKAINEAYNKAIQEGDTASELLDVIDKNSVKISDNIRTMVWTPIYPEIVADGKVYDSLKEGMEEADKKATVNGSKFAVADKDRTLQGMDLFITKKKHSPVLIGAKGVSGLGQVSKLHLGSVNGATTSGDIPTNQYVRFIPNASGTPKVQKESFYKGTMSKGNYLLGGYTAESFNYSGSFTEGTVGQESAIGADNYGNVINGETGDVVVPYWQNHMFADVGLTKTFFPYSPAIATYGELYDSLDESMLSVEGLASDAKIEKFVGSKGSLYNNALEVKKMLGKGQTIENSMNALNKGIGSLNKEESMRALAVVISASTQDAVKAWNTAMLKDAKDGGELYMSFEPLMVDKSYEDAMDSKRWTAASLIQKMGWIMDYGFADMIRLTVVSNLTRTYNSTIGEAGLEYIFYTDTVTNSEGWASVTVLLSTVIGAVLMGYLLFIGFKAYRGNVTWSQVIMKAVVLAGVLFYPMFVYGNIVEYTINKPTAWIMGNQMRLSVVLDTYFAEDNTSRNINAFYENMFGKYADSDAMQMGSYNVTFYTTTDKSGFDINKTDPQDKSLSTSQRYRLERYQTGYQEYPKDQLISVKVPLTDLYKWVWDVRYNGEGMESATYGRGSEMPTYEDVVNTGKVPALFQWLAMGGSQYFGVEGYDEDLATYEEYKMMPQEVSGEKNKDIEAPDGLSTYGAGVRAYQEKNKIGRDAQVTALQVEGATGLEVVSGSELFYAIVYNTSQDDMDNNIGSLDKLSKLATTPENLDTKYYKPTDGDIRALVRDLSTTSKGRFDWYGDENGWSNFSRATLGDKNGTGGTFIDLDGKERELQDKPNLTSPREDFLGLTHIVQKYQPNRGEVNPYKRKTLESDVSTINKNLLNNYLSTYSITKMSLGADEDRNQSALNHAEKMVMATEAFFQFNKALGWSHFPNSYAVDSIKFDKYMALVFIPFKDYGKETMTFYDDSTVIPMSTAEYIGMNDSIWEYGAFMIAVLAMIIFGMFYLAILYFGLLVFSMYNFVKYYIIKSDYKNKSALGSLTIMLVLSGCKMALMLVVWLTSWIMNKTVALSAQNLPSYPVTLSHSIALVATVGAIFFVVIRPVWKGVMGDRENMGGQYFSDKAESAGKKLTSGAFLPGRGKGVSGGSQASKFNKGKQRTGNDMRNNAGRLGNMDERGLQKARKQAGTLGGVFGVGGGSNIGTSTKRRIDKVTNAMGRASDKRKGIDRAGRAMIDPSKVKATNLVERAQLNELARGMNGVVQTASGLGTEVVKGALIGQELQNFQTGMITTMALGSAGAAAVVAKNLASKGIKARTDGNDVLFDSSGYDLSDTAVRSELFNNSVADLQNQNIEKHASIDKGKVDGSTAINYDYSKGDSRIGLPLDSKTGIHPETFNQLSNTAEFKELFIKPRVEELSYDRKGNIGGLPEGGLRLVNPQMSASEVQQKMNNIYNVDNNLRQENNLDERSKKDMNALKIDGMEENYYNQHVAPLIKDQKGMYTQGSRVVYNSANPQHQAVLQQVNKSVKEYNKGIEQNYGNESNNLMRYVMKDGDNQGIVTNTVNGDDNAVLATMVYGDKNYKQNVRKFKVDESETGTIGDTVQAITNLRNTTVGGDTQLSHTVNEFTKAKKDLRNILTSEVTGMSSQDQKVYNMEMMDYLNTTQVGNSAEYKTVKSNLHDIENRYKQQEISEDQYLDLVRRENNNLMNIMDSSGKLDGFILQRYNETNPYVKAYERKHSKKDKKTGKPTQTLKDRYNQSADKLDKEVGRKNLMEMPLGVLESTVSKNGEEYQLDGKGVLVQRADARRKRNTLDGKDKDAVMSYLMKRPIDIKDVRSRKLGSQ